LNEKGEKLPLPMGYCDKLRLGHTAKDRDNWNYIESVCNQCWTWDDMAPKLDGLMYLVGGFFKIGLGILQL
jgi:hypothetical protein